MAGRVMHASDSCRHALACTAVHRAAWTPSMRNPHEFAPHAYGTVAHRLTRHALQARAHANPHNWSHHHSLTPLVGGGHTLPATPPAARSRGGRAPPDSRVGGARSPRPLGAHALRSRPARGPRPRRVARASQLGAAPAGRRGDGAARAARLRRARRADPPTPRSSLHSRSFFSPLTGGCAGAGAAWGGTTRTTRSSRRRGRSSAR